jgi:TonB family protein
VPTVVTGRAEVRGSLDKESIRRVIRRHINEVKYCYVNELQTLRASGRVEVRFTIGPTGRVVAARVVSTTLGAPSVEECVAQAVRRWVFPACKCGGIVIVNYPFYFRYPGDE